VSSAAGLSLDAQPAALTDSVSRNGLVSDMGSLYATRRSESHAALSRQHSAGRGSWPWDAAGERFNLVAIAGTAGSSLRSE